MTYDCVVVGLGGMGSSVLYHLALQGLNVLGLERFGPAHHRGSSHGETRIIRKAYFEHPDYVPLLNSAYELWRDLESTSGKSLFVPCGVVLSGLGEGEAVTGSLRSACEHHLSVESLDAATARERFPRFNFPQEHTVVYEPDAGFLRVEDCVRTALDEAAKLGAQTRFDESLTSWSVRNGEVHLQSPAQTYIAKQVVFTSGAWSPTLLTTTLPELNVLRKVQVWYPIENTEGQRLQHEPAFYLETPAGAFYGIPEVHTGLVKIAEHTATRDVADPDQLDRQLHASDTCRLDVIARNFLNGVSPQSKMHAVCMYTMSPDGHFIIDRHPQFKNVHIAAGFSGHGFKFASVIGKALADCVTTGQTDLPIGFLGLHRFLRQ